MKRRVMSAAEIKTILSNAEDFEILPAVRDLVSSYSMDMDMVLSAVRAPQHIGVDPHTAEVDYPVLRLKRGDITVSVGLLDEHRPALIYLHMGRRSELRNRNPGHTGTAKTPVSLQARIAWFKERGCVEQWDNGKVKIWLNNELVTTLHTTVHTRGNSYKSNWSRDMRQFEAVKARQLARQ